MLVGNRDEFRLGERAGEVVLKVAKPLLVGPLRRSRAIEASQVAKAMIVIALHGKKQPVTIYPSQELEIMDFPVDKEGGIAQNHVFNWDKRKSVDARR